MYIYMKFIHILAEYLYIYPVNAYCRRISLYLGSSCILQENISIPSQFMNIPSQYIYIYIYLEFIDIAGIYLYI